MSAAIRHKVDRETNWRGIMVDANMVVRELLRLGAYLQREGARMTREYGLTQQQFVVLVVVREQGPISQKEIVSDLLYEKSNVSKSITRLEKLGLVSTRRGDEDSRVVLCEATEQGEQVVKSCMQTMKEGNERWLRHVRQDDLTQVWKVLRELGPMV